MALKRILVTGGTKVNAFGHFDLLTTRSRERMKVFLILLLLIPEGVGKAICEKLLYRWSNTHVVLGSRDDARGAAAITDIVHAVGGDSQDRLELMVLDTSSDDSVKEAASQFQGELYGIINNARIGFDQRWTVEEQVATDYFGPRRVNEAFRPFLQSPGGHIVNVASSSGPIYVSHLTHGSQEKEFLSKPWTIPGGIAQVDQMATQTKSVHQFGYGYGFSKALLNAYTHIHAKLEKDLIINSVSPGNIITDLTAGMPTVTDPPSKGAYQPCFLIMDEKIAVIPSGRFYGSDCIRSPFSFYRRPGFSPYKSEGDLAELPETAKKPAFILQLSTKD